MENKVQVKKILRKIYNIDYKNISLRDDDEFILQGNGVSEFTQMLRKIDTDNGIIVTPSGYRSGLFYSSENDGEIYSSSRLLPDIINFSFNIYGLKKGYFYRITILTRDTDGSTTITDNREITVIDDSRQIILSTNVKGFDKNQEFTGYFRALSNEANLNFSVGKVVIKDIIIDEVVLAEEAFEQAETELTEETIANKISLVTYGIFGLVGQPPAGYKGRYISLTKYSGRGIELFYDQIDKKYVLERSNTENLDNDPFTNLNYVIDFNFNKLPNAGIYDTYRTVKVSTDISPNTMKQGYIEFEFIKDGKSVEYTDTNGRAFISISKIQ